MPYSIDTSGLTHGWRDRYPPDVFPAIWDNISDLIDNGELVASEEVLRELETGSDDLYDWACAHPRMFIPLSNDIQEAVTNILAAQPRWVPADRGRNMADPFVVAVAIVRGCAVVSAETWSTSPYPERVKIPNVCGTFGAQHIEFLEMMRRQGWVFTR